MKRLSPEALRLLELARVEDDPSAADQARIERAVASRIALGIGAIAAVRGASKAGEALDAVAKANGAPGITLQVGSAASAPGAVTTAGAAGVALASKGSMLLFAIGMAGALAAGGWLASGAFRSHEAPNRSETPPATSNSGVLEPTVPRNSGVLEPTVPQSFSGTPLPPQRSPGDDDTPPIDHWRAAGQHSEQGPSRATLPSSKSDAERSPSPQPEIAHTRSSTPRAGAVPEPQRDPSHDTSRSVSSAVQQSARAHQERSAPPPPEGMPSTVRTAPSPSDDLDREIGGLRAAQRALRTGNHQRALGLLDEQNADYPNGVLQEERDAARVLALCDAGWPERARVEAELFERRWPRSTLLVRVRSACRKP